MSRLQLPDIRIDARFSLLVMALLLLFACSDSHEDKLPPVKEPNEQDVLKLFHINGDTPNVLYTYMDEKGAYQTVEKSDDVPDPFRNDVLVVPLSVPPEKRLAATKVAVADLNSKTKDGFFPVELEDRSRYENAVKLKRKWRLSQVREPMPQYNAAQLKGQAPAARDRVVLYGASWCGYCRKVKHLLEQNKVPFVERDIEKDDQAAKEMMASCAADGVQCSGVPVVDWMGQLVLGYDEATLKRLMHERPPKAAVPAAPATPTKP